MYVVARRLGAVSVAAVLAVSLTSCTGMLGKRVPGGAAPNGIMEMEPAEAVETALQTVRELDDASYAGEVAFDFPTGSRDVRLRATSVLDGPCEVSISDDTLGTMDVRMIGRHLYSRADPRILSVGFDIPQEQASAFRGHWLERPVPDDVGGGCGIDVLAGMSEIEGNGCVPYAVEEVRGVPTRAFQCWGSPGRPIVYVATEGEPLVLRTVGEPSSGSYDLRLVRSNTHPSIEAPPPAQVIGSGEYA